MRWKLFLDDERYPVGNDWIIARNYNDAVWYVQNWGIPYCISFDHDLGISLDELVPARTGMDFAKWLCEFIMDYHSKLPNEFNFYVHSQNPIGAKNIQSHMAQFVDFYRKGPFKD